MPQRQRSQRGRNGRGQPETTHPGSRVVPHTRTINTPTPSNSNQLHIDLGALAQRVTGTENAIVNLSNQFTDLSNSFSSQMRDLGNKIDIQQANFNKDRATNWTGFTQASMAVVGVVIALIGAIMWPQITGLAKIEALVEKMQDTYVRVSDMNASSEILRERLTKFDSAISTLFSDKIGVREHEEFKTRIIREFGEEVAVRKESDSRVDQALRDLDSQLVKRPEINAANQALGARLDALSARYDVLQKQLADYAAVSPAGHPH